jgi:hypothetical protein
MPERFMSLLWEIVRAEYLIKVLLYQLGCGFQTGLDIGSLPVRARRQAPCGNAGPSQLGYEGSKAISLVSDSICWGMRLLRRSEIIHS